MAKEVERLVEVSETGLSRMTSWIIVVRVGAWDTGRVDISQAGPGHEIAASAGSDHCRSREGQQGSQGDTGAVGGRGEGVWLFRVLTVQYFPPGEDQVKSGAEAGGHAASSAGEQVRVPGHGGRCKCKWGVCLMTVFSIASLVQFPYCPPSVGEEEDSQSSGAEEEH